MWSSRSLPKLWMGALLSALVLSACAPSRSSDPIEATTLDGELVDLFSGSPSAVALIFVTLDCPISNRYVPVINQLHRDFDRQGVRLFVVYADPAFERDLFVEHRNQFGIEPTALVDADQKLVELTGVQVTPEVAVLAADGALVYRGRIDDQYVDFGRFRPQASEHDLRVALQAVLAGERVPNDRQPAIGCYIQRLSDA